MIKSRHSPIVASLFRHYLRWIMKKNFNSIHLIDKSTYGGRSIILLQNHFSWWDGFFTLIVNEEIFKKRYHVMMLESQLVKHSILGKLGAFGVDKNNPKSIIKSFAYMAELLKDDNNLVNFFPQGEIQNSISSFAMPEGYKLLLSQNPNSHVRILYVSVEYGSNRKPSIYMTLNDFDPSLELDDAFETCRDSIDLDIINGNFTSSIKL